MFISYFNIEKFHSVDADDPFFDGNLMKKSMNLLEEGYDVVCPTESSSAGDASVGYSLTKNILRVHTKEINKDMIKIINQVEKTTLIKNIDI